MLTSFLSRYSHDDASEKAQIVAGRSWHIEVFFQLSSFLRAKLYKNDTLDASDESIAHAREPSAVEAD